MSKEKSGSINKGLSGLTMSDPAQDNLIQAGIQAVREGMSEKEFEEKFGNAMKDPGDKKKTIGRMSRPVGRRSDTLGGKAKPTEVDDCKLSNIILKVTTFTDANSETPSFVVDSRGARIGRDAGNDITIASDTKMASFGHATIEFSDGSFFLRDGGFEYSASVKLLPKRLAWVLEPDARFSAGASVFKSCGLNAEGSLLIEIVAGPLKGERRFVTKKGISIGRANDNGIALPADRELSRKHSQIVFDDTTAKYYVCDVGSTNGTYMQLVGPYGMRYRLNLNDNILVGRTGFSVNRYDIGFSEEMELTFSEEAKRLCTQVAKFRTRIVNQGGERPDPELVDILGAELCRLVKLLIPNVHQKLDEFIYAQENNLKVNEVQHGADLIAKDDGLWELKVSTVKKTTKSRCNFNWPIVKNANADVRRKKLLANIKEKTQGGGAILIAKDSLQKELAEYKLTHDFLMEYFKQLELTDCATHNMGCEQCSVCKGFHRLEKLKHKHKS